MIESEDAGGGARVGLRGIERVRNQLATLVQTIAKRSATLARHWSWPLLAILIGALPLAISFVLQCLGHQWVSAVSLAVLCIGFVYDDRWIQCIAVIALAFVAHSVLAIGLSANDPVAAEAILPKAADYWDRQHKWITTGVNEEYEVASWLPGHIQMFFGITIFSFTSFGTVVFHDGFVQVDMMNYYNAQLANASQSDVRAVGFGWHIWSVMRGIGYLFVSCEMISLAVQVFSRERISTLARRLTRWGLGIGFLTADCVIKFFAVEAVRQQLFDNMR